MKKESKSNILTDIYNLNLLGDPEKDEKAITTFFQKYDQAVVSLDTYKSFMEHSWFESSGVKEFYELYDLSRELVDGVFEGTIITKIQLTKVEKLLENVVPCLGIIDKRSNKLIDLNLIKPTIDYNEFHFFPYIKFLIPDRIWKNHFFTINLGFIKFQLFNVIVSVLNGEIVIKKCELTSCGRAFVANRRGPENIYCSDNHRKKAFALRRSKRTITS